MSRGLAHDARDAEPVRLDVGRLGEDFIAVQAGAGNILPEHIGQRERVRRRRDPLDVERGYICGMLEDGGQLGRVKLQLLLGKAEAGQAGYMSHIGPRDGPDHLALDRCI
jgi:hypothetical protein